jgi:argininosuccinate lyase
MKLWGGRFEAGPSEVFERFSGSLHFDRRLLAADIRGSQAYARALAGAGILNQEEAAGLVASFGEILNEATQPDFYDGASDEDVHTLVIRKLKEKAGTLADKIHTGRSRNEQVSLDTRLWLRDEIDRALELLARLMQCLLDAARRNPDAIVPGYTHLRRAQAVLWAHYLLAYFEMFFRDSSRLHAARRAVNVMPLGSGALAGSGFPIDRQALARELEFEDITRNSLDVSADRDFVLDFLYASSTILLHLSRLAEDWILYSSDEFGWLELGDGVTSGSSLMPQKKNPDSLELIRGKAGRVFGDFTSLFVTMKGLPMTYNRDMQEDKEPLFDAAHQLTGSLEMACGVVDSTRLKPDGPKRAAAEGWTVATDLAEALSRSGVPFHQAHQIVGRLVLESSRAGKLPADWTASDLVRFDARFQPEMIKLMDPSEGMKTRSAPGGTAPATVAAALDEAASRLRTLYP